MAHVLLQHSEFAEQEGVLHWDARIHNAALRGQQTLVTQTEHIGEIEGEMPKSLSCFGAVHTNIPTSIITGIHAIYRY